MLAIGTLHVLALVMVVGSLLASHFCLTRAIFWGETAHFSARGKYGQYRACYPPA
jgi:hypothetical protein